MGQGGVVQDKVKALGYALLAERMQDVVAEDAKYSKEPLEIQKKSCS